MAPLNPPTITTKDNLLPNTDHNYAKGSGGISTSPEKSMGQNSTHDSGANWQVVSKRRVCDPSTMGQKKSRQENSSTCSIELQNSFDILSSVHESGMDADVAPAKLSEPKPPPIFIPDVGNVQTMIRTFESVVSKDDFSYKCVNNNSVKILPKSADIYRRLVHKLEEANVSFHYYQLKQERAYRVVLKNMHYSVDTAELKAALGQLGHTVRNITNVIQSSTKKPLSMFFVDLEPSPNNKDIYNVQYLLHAKVTFEPPYKKKEIVQCKRCQQYGHTKSYCRHPFRCVKCGKDHDTSACDKDGSTPAVCVLCGGAHPANYKGCTVYKSIQSRSNTQLGRRTDKPKAIVTRPSSPIYRPIQPNLSYAEVTKHVDGGNNNAGDSQRTVITRTNENTANDLVTQDRLTNTINTFFDRFEKMFIEQSKQIGTLLDLLTTILKKVN